jgi:hypothetical protein
MPLPETSRKYEIGDGIVPRQYECRLASVLMQEDAIQPGRLPAEALEVQDPEPLINGEQKRLVHILLR